jgi:hypothetical protein
MKKKSLLFLLLTALFMPLALHAQQSLPYSNSWEDDDDFTGWSLFSNPSGTAGIYQDEGIGIAHSGVLTFGFRYDNEGGYLISPLFTGGDNGIDVSFWYKEYSSDYGDEQFMVGYTTSDEDITDPENEFIYGNVITASTEWQQYTFSFPAGTKRIAVKYIYNNTLYLFLDDFEFTATGAAVCNRPTGLTASNVGSRTATISWTSDASAWQICVNDDEAHLINVSQTSYTFSGLTPDTEYNVKVRTNCGNNNLSAWASVNFTTEVACTAPEDLAATDITSTSANIGWTSNNNNFKLQYRPLNPNSNNFEKGLGNWTTIDADGDGLGWENHINTGTGNFSTHSGDGCAVSGSYDSNAGALTPDNYLVSPQLSLGGSISFWACAQDADWAAEHFGVAVSTTGNTNASDFTTIQEWTMTAKSGNRDSGAYYFYTVDLSAFSGQGYVAIRHFDCTDMFYLDVDDITIVEPTDPTWTTINNATNPQALTGLTPETTYEVQVQTVCGGQDGSSAWASTTFTTLPSCVAPTDLTITNITTSSATVAWTGSASSYNLKVNDQVYNNVNSPYYLRNLTAATVYTIEVQSVCSATSTSSWTSTEFVTEFCEEADKCELTFVLGDSYGDGWNGGYIDVIDVATNMSIANMAALDGGGNGQTYDTLTLAVCNGRNIRFVWHSGSWDSETSFIVNDVNGDEIFSGSGYNFSNDAVISTHTVDCFSSCRKPTDFQVVEITANSVTLSWTENGEATAWVVSYSSGVSPQTINATETTVTINVNPETSYTARVRPVCDVDDKWSDEISFTTPATCPLPSDITVETEPTSATLSWTGSVDSYNVRYRLATAACFDDGTLGDWTTIDADGDGNTWYAINTVLGNNESAGSATSASYSNGAALTPDNYLVSPQVTLGGSISFYACAQDASWAKEHFGVAVSTTGNTDAADFTTIAEWTMNADGTGTEGPAKVQGVWGVFNVDLSDYAGQTGYVAIRHFDCTDMFRLNVDDINIIQPGVENPWITLSTTETTITLPNLQIGTNYEYQMQSVCEGSPTEWTATNYFSTIGSNIFITEGEWNDGGNWLSGSVPEDGADVYILANVTIPANTIAIVDNITIEEGGSLTIADGGQLKHSNEVHGTIQKFIAGYDDDPTNPARWYLLGAPMCMDSTLAVRSGMVDFVDDHADFDTHGIDLYEFSQNNDLEWVNLRTGNRFSIMGINRNLAYLYARANGTTLNFSTAEDEAFVSTSDDVFTIAIRSISTSEPELIGWNLLRNHYTCNAYLASGRDFYRMNAAGDAIVLATDENGGQAIKPCEGFFVVVGEHDIEEQYPNPTTGNTMSALIQMTTTEPQPDGAKGMMDIMVKQEGQLADVARVRFGEGDRMGKLVLRNDATRLSITQDGKDYSVVYNGAQGELPLSFKAKKNGQYTITVNPEGVELGYLHLIDNMTGADIDLLATPALRQAQGPQEPATYTFTAKTTDYESRFKLVFTTNMEDGASTGSATFAFYSDGNWIIANEGEATLQVIDINGRILSSESINGSVSKAVQATPGVYVLRLVNGNDVKTQKIVVR